jgi:hypothetical protein
MDSGTNQAPAGNETLTQIYGDNITIWIYDTLYETRGTVY